MIKLDNDTYIISDLHFFHGNIVRYCHRDYNITNNNYFENKDELDRMNENILKMFDELPPSCDIYNLGDLFFMGESHKKWLIENVDTLKSMVSRMSNNGKRRLFLVLGNHDNLHLPNESRISFYEDLGFNKVYDTPIVIENNWILCHEPVYSNGNFNVIYGHTHDLPIKEDYFTYDYDNYAMIKRCYKQNGLPEPVIEQKWPDRLVDLSKYTNVCLDYTHKFIRLQDIINEKNN